MVTPQTFKIKHIQVYRSYQLLTKKCHRMKYFASLAGRLEVVEASEVELYLKEGLDTIHKFTKKAEEKVSNSTQVTTASSMSVTNLEINTGNASQNNTEAVVTNVASPLQEESFYTVGLSLYLKEK